MGAICCSIPLAAFDCCRAAPAGAESAESICIHAKKLYDGGKTGLAILEYDRAIMLSPDSHAGYRGRGLAYLRIGRIERALADFDKANEELGPYREQKFPGLGGYLDWQRAHVEYQEANKDLQSGNYDRAIMLYNTALAIYPTFPQCMHNLGIALSKKGDHDSAALRCMEAISYRQGDWKFWKTFGLELHMKGRYKFALQAMEHAKELHPPGPDEVEIIESLENIKDAIRQDRDRSLW